MKKLPTLQFLILLLISMHCLTSKAQILLEQDYDSASFQLTYVRLQHAGEKYAWVQNPQLGSLFPLARKINLYNLNHSLWKSINLSAIPPFSGITGAPKSQVLYISDSLFATDSLLEFMYTASYYVTGSSAGEKLHTYIYNENMVQLFSDSVGIYNWNLMGFPDWLKTNQIFNTSQGTKMILNSNKPPYRAKVYSLPGMYLNVNKSYVLDQAEIPESAERMNIYPNPSNDFTTVSYALPKDVETAKMVFYDLNGKQVKSFTIDHTFTSLRLSISDINTGSYYCQVECDKGIISSKKLIKIN